MRAKFAFTFVITTCLISLGTTAQNVGINTDGSNPTMMLDVKTSPSAVSDGIRINNPNTGNGDAILNFQNNGVDVWTIGFDDDDADAFKIDNGGSLTNTPAFNIETGGKVGVNTTNPNARLHVDGAAGEDVFRLQTNGTTKMLMESDGQISIGAFFSPDDQVDIRGNVQVDQGYLRVGNATSTAIRKYGVQEFTWNGNLFVNNNQPSFLTQNIGTFTIPAGIPAGTTIRVDKMLWEVDAIHEDGNEDKQIEVRIGTGAWGGYFETVQDGAIAIDWHYVQDYGTGGFTFTTNQTVQFRAMDDDCCFSDEMYVYNMHVKIFYSYTLALQPGDISSEGRIYANSDKDVGDLAEYFEVDETEAGLIVSLLPGTDNQYSSTKKAFDQNMIGVISENPSVVLNNPNIGPPVALAGRVKVKVRADQPLIKSGDFLTSSEGGYAIKANKPGPTIGFAVENQRIGESKVEIIVQPGRYFVPEEVSLVTESIAPIDEISEKITEQIPVRKLDNDKDNNDLKLPLGRYKTINGIPVELVKKKD